MAQAISTKAVMCFISVDVAMGVEMARQAGFFDLDERYVALSTAGDPLEKLGAVVNFEAFRYRLEKALSRSESYRGTSFKTWPNTANCRLKAWFSFVNQYVVGTSIVSQRLRNQTFPAQFVVQQRVRTAWISLSDLCRTVQEFGDRMVRR